MSERAFYTVKQVAALLGLRQHAVLALIKSGAIPSINIALTQTGRPRWRILPSDFEAWVSKRTHQPSTPRRRRRKQTTVKQYF